MPTVKKPRRIDRDRRARIIRAAIEVMEQDGVQALTHRRAAAAAGVPLAATTYYFDSLGDLLSAALQEIGSRAIAELQARVEAIPEDASMATVLAQSICEGATIGARTSIVTTEFWAAALRHEQVREVALALHAAELEILQRRVGRNTARAAMAATAGLSQHALLTREPPSEEEMISIIAPLLPETA